MTHYKRGFPEKLSCLSFASSACCGQMHMFKINSDAHVANIACCPAKRKKIIAKEHFCRVLVDHLCTIETLEPTMRLKHTKASRSWMHYTNAQSLDPSQISYGCLPLLNSKNNELPRLFTVSARRDAWQRLIKWPD